MDQEQFRAELGAIVADAPHCPPQQVGEVVARLAAALLASMAPAAPADTTGTA